VYISLFFKIGVKMNIAISKECGEWILLTNEDLKIGDAVFPLVSTYHNNGKIFIIDMIRPSDSKESILACTGWPSHPHVVQRFFTEDGICYIETDKGYSPAIQYFKII